MSRRRAPRWPRTLQRELATQRRDNPGAVVGLLVLWLVASGGLAVWLWSSRWQELRSEQTRQSETHQGLLDLRVNSHKVTVLDWGHWDPLHRFAGGQDPDFVAREVIHSSIIRDGQVLAIVTANTGLLSFPPGAVSPELRRCLDARLQELERRNAGGRLDQTYGFYCRDARTAYVGAATNVLATEGRGPARGWLLHFSRIERPSYNSAVNTAFREISEALSQGREGDASRGSSEVPSISELLPPRQTFTLQPTRTPLQQQLQALQDTVMPWLFMNALVAASAGGGLLGLRRLRFNQRLSEWHNRSRLRQLRQELPGPLLSQWELLERINREAEALGPCWIAALRVQVTMFSGDFSRSSAHTHALGQLGERLQRQRFTRCLALGEESHLLLVFQPTTPQRPDQELERIAALLQEAQERVAHGIKLQTSGLVTPLDSTRARQQLADLALVLSLSGHGGQPLVFQPEGVAIQAHRLREQLHIDFSVNQLAENLRDLRYELEPVMAFEGDRRRIVYNEMLFRLPVEMDQSLTVQEVILSLERNNNIHLIDQLMLRKAIELLRRRGDSSEKLGINLSAVTFCSGQHFEEIKAQLRSLPEQLRGSLVLEVTETAIVEKADQWSVKLQQLRELGVQIAIDDFGVGFASIAYLFRFQADYLKLDLSYSQRLGDSNVDALVDFLLAYSQHNDCSLILEGIETTRQLECWRHRGVSLFQGYLFHEPGSRPEAPAGPVPAEI